MPVELVVCLSIYLSIYLPGDVLGRRDRVPRQPLGTARRVYRVGGACVSPPPTLDAIHATAGTTDRPHTASVSVSLTLDAVRGRRSFVRRRLWEEELTSDETTQLWVLCCLPGTRASGQHGLGLVVGRELTVDAWLMWSPWETDCDMMDGWNLGRGRHRPASEREYTAGQVVYYTTTDSVLGRRPQQNLRLRASRATHSRAYMYPTDTVTVGGVMYTEKARIGQGDFFHKIRTIML